MRGRKPIDQILAAQPWDSLRPFLLGTDADVDAAIGRLHRFSALLLEWNRNVSNLISKNDEARLLERHLRESLEPARWITRDPAARWIDFGSGAGLPAIPLAIAGVGQRWTLVESRRQKTLFIRKALQEIELANNDVLNMRLEELVKTENHGEGFDAFTSRATMRLGPTLEMASQLVRAGGSAFLWKGSQREAEMNQDSNWEKSWEFEGSMLIGTGGTHVAKFIRRR